MEPEAGPDAAGTSATGSRVTATRWLATSNPAGMMQGAVVMAAMLAVVGEQEAPVGTVVAAAAGVLLIYWLTHAYTNALGRAITSDQQRLGPQLLQSAKHEIAVLEGGIPATMVFCAALLLGASLSLSVDVALWTSVLLLATVGYLTGHTAGVTGWRLAGDTLLAALAGAFMILLKMLLHADH